MKIISYPSKSTLAVNIAAALSGDLIDISLHYFPDTEIKITVNGNVLDDDVWIIASLDHVNDRIMGLILLMDTCRSLGARSIKLCCAYLPYMRQDKRFHPGESISAEIFAGLISHYADALITVDPHCHRIPVLSEIFSIPCRTLHAQMLLKQYIASHVKDPLIIGPDAESEQWVADLATSLNAPYQVLSKQRFGDASVAVDVPDLSLYQGKMPVLVDDIVSTGKTMIAALDKIMLQGFKSPFVIAVHGLFVEQAYDELQKRTSRIMTTNSIQHVSNQVDLSPLIAEGIKDVS